MSRRDSPYLINVLLGFLSFFYQRIRPSWNVDGVAEDDFKSDREVYTLGFPTIRLKDGKKESPKEKGWVRDTQRRKEK